MSQQKRRFLSAVAVAVVIGGSAGATTVTLGDPGIQLTNAGANDIGFSTGFGIFFVTNVLGGLAGPGTTATVSTTDTISGMPRLFNLPYDGDTANPNNYSLTIPDRPGLHGPWTMTFSNDGDTTTQVVALPAGATQLPFITNLTVSGSASNPTFDWTAPAGRPVEGYRINLYDQDLVNKTGTRANGVLTTTIRTSEFTVPTELAGGLTLDPTHRYTIQINALENRDGSANLSNANVFARSRSYFDFTPATSGGDTFTYLPMVDADGIFHYDVTDITAGTTIEVDPAVAIGYIYAIGTGDPNFASVDLPTGIGDGKYDIYGLNAAGGRILLAHDWLGGDVLDFGADGVNWFEVLGIEDGAGLDPSDTTAFVTGLTFTADGSFTGTQTPVTAMVPEPPGIALFGSGVLGFLLLGRRRARSGSIVLAAVLTGLAGCALPPAAPPPGTQLSAAGLRATLVGNTGYGTSSDGNHWTGYNAPDGSAKIKYAGGVDTGTWRITDDGHWCTRWNHIRVGTEWCQRVFQEGDTVRFVHDGSVSSTAQLKLGNPENL